MQMTKLGRVGNWIQVSANVGILAGLLLVGLQMKQNSDLLKIQLSYAESGRYIQNERVMWGENPAEIWAKSIEKPALLTLAEQRVIESIIWVNVEEWQAAYRLSKLNLMEDEWKDRVRNEVSFILANDFGRAWWTMTTDEKNQTEGLGEFYNFVNSELASKPNRNKNFFYEIMQNIKSGNTSEGNE
ncbi:MAG: hypothetical protein ACI9WC_001407 [Arenicella sp.]|jgi:hypothetical protein